MKKKHITINRLISENGFKNYLEIGYGVGTNFNSIEVDSKMTCDPATVEMEVKDGDKVILLKPTSDEFFEIVTDRFDVIFVDGLHHADQVERDIVNAWSRLKIGGMIILHDVLPPSEKAQLVPRVQNQWTGDVWRAFVGFRQSYPQIETRYYPEKYGLGVIIKDRKKVTEGFVNNELTYLDFMAEHEFHLGFDLELIKEYS